ncbi:MAG: alpha/beta hydrolase fold domain-containing protein [Pseudoxanthomonas sp.]
MSTPYAPQHPADIADLAFRYPLAWLTTGMAGDLGTSLLPVQLECDAEGAPVRVLGHLGRHNPQLRVLAGQPLATFLLLGPSGYVSPSWFADRTRAPTWNFAWAALDVEVELRDAAEDADAALHGLVAQVEAGRPGAWRIGEMGERYARLRRGVVAFVAQVRTVRSRFKLGQDERDDVFADILRALDATGQGDLAAWMRRFGHARAPQALPGAWPPPAPLDPEVMRFVDDVRASTRRLAAGRRLDWPARRELAEIARAPWRQGGPETERRELAIATAAGMVRLRLYDPAPGRRKPALVYLHGGGWALFSLDTHDRVMREYAQAAGMAVIGVDYALAPEVRYPGALEQVVAVVRWLGEHAAELGVDPARLALGGDSAGGSLAFGAALRLRDAGDAGTIKAILSLYGGFGPDCSPTALQRYGTAEDMLGAQEIQEFWDTYAGHVRDRRDPCMVPLLARLDGLPPAFLAIAECDALAEQNLQMAGSLLAAGVDVRARVYRGMPHSFIEAVAVSATARQALGESAAWLRSMLG